MENISFMIWSWMIRVRSVEKTRDHPASPLPEAIQSIASFENGPPPNRISLKSLPPLGLHRGGGPVFGQAQMNYCTW